MADGRWRLSALAEDYLVESSPTYMGFLFDLTLGGDWSTSMLDAAVTSNRPQRPDIDFANFEAQVEQPGCSPARSTRSASRRRSSGPG